MSGTSSCTSPALFARGLGLAGLVGSGTSRWARGSMVGSCTPVVFAAAAAPQPRSPAASQPWPTAQQACPPLNNPAHSSSPLRATA